MPQHTRDPIAAAAQLITSLQTIVSRGVDPLDAAVVSVTRINAGHAYNVIPAAVHMAGTLRYFSDAVRDKIAADLQRIVDGCAATFGITAELERVNIFSVTRNDPTARGEVLKAAAEIVGPAGITEMRPTAGSEDFAEMLAVVPGAYFHIGHGGNKALHHPEYIFDDNAIPIAASVLARLVEQHTQKAA